MLESNVTDYSTIVYENIQSSKKKYLGSTLKLQDLKMKENIWTGFSF